MKRIIATLLCMLSVVILFTACGKDETTRVKELDGTVWPLTGQTFSDGTGFTAEDLNSYGLYGCLSLDGSKLILLGSDHGALAVVSVKVSPRFFYEFLTDASLGEHGIVQLVILFLYCVQLCLPVGDILQFGKAAILVLHAVTAQHLLQLGLQMGAAAG